MRREAARIAWVAIGAALIAASSGCASRDAWPPWLSPPALRAIIAIALIPVVLYLIYKGYDDRPGGGWGE